GDCNDDDPLIHAETVEICANGKDDDCDGQVDELECGYPEHDVCADPIELESGKPTIVSTRGAKLDYASSCVRVGAPSLRDIVAAITIEDGAPVDLDVSARGAMGSIWVSTATQCGDASTELACAGSSDTPQGSVARFIARGVQPGVYPVLVATDMEQDVTLRAVLRVPTPPPTNETCGTAVPVEPGTTVTAEIVGIAADLATACATTLGELVYSFTLDESQDVFVYAGSVDGLGNPTIGLRGPGCVDVAEELSCKSGAAPTLYQRALQPGTYYVSVSATAPTSVSFRVEVRPPRVPPDDERCEGAPLLAHNKSVDVPLDMHLDDLSCLAGAPDAVYALELAERSDVLLLGRLTQGDDGAVSLWEPPCETTQQLSCDATMPSPVRTAVHDLGPGGYRAAIESRLGNPTQLTALVRVAQPPTVVAFADTCEDALAIPLAGGLFQGNSANATAQYAAGCDQAGAGAGGAPDQVLRLELTNRRRVAFDMRGSSYRTLLNVRRGPSCPGEEIAGACAVGYYAQRSFLDLTLEAGVYFVQVDGFFGEAGAWFLDVFVVEP
ncbi:MAG: putative metal-binding motif-containing protein, partial [Polyangiaceae bacterium]|nr:putative metal-binding motif-containing protein [Polyangiaceae bacterium]